MPIRKVCRGSPRSLGFLVYFPKKELICLRLLLSITSRSLEERWEAATSGNLPKEKSMKQINPSQTAMTQ